MLEKFLQRVELITASAMLALVLGIVLQGIYVLAK
jgi:hypothetical protein